MVPGNDWITAARDALARADRELQEAFDRYCHPARYAVDAHDRDEVEFAREHFARRLLRAAIVREAVSDFLDQHGIRAPGSTPRNGSTS